VVVAVVVLTPIVPLLWEKAVMWAVVFVIGAFLYWKCVRIVPYGEEPPARPLFRKLALATAIVCFLLAGLYGVGAVPGQPLDHHKWGAVGIWLLIGFAQVTIWKAGYWPGPKR
jgi:phosphatidylglycerophosphate synthase